MKHFYVENYSKVKRKGKAFKSFLKQSAKFLKQDHSRAIRVAGVIIFATAAAIFVNQSDFFWKGANLRNPQQRQDKNIVIPEVERSASGKITRAFPSDIPLNEEAGIKESFKATYPNNQISQASVTFVTKKTDEENLVYYLAWARENSWEIVNLGDEPPFLYLKKGGEDINISFNRGDVIISHIKRL